MSREKKITIKLNLHQAEALFCLLRVPFDAHDVYNQNNGLTYVDVDEDVEDDHLEDTDVVEMNAARIEAAKQLYAALPAEVQNRHDGGIEE